VLPTALVLAVVPVLAWVLVPVWVLAPVRVLVLDALLESISSSSWSNELSLLPPPP
jgi:hypothetical protein